MTQSPQGWLNANLDRINALDHQGHSPQAIAKELEIRPCKSGIAIDRRYVALLGYLRQSPKDWLECHKEAIKELKAQGLNKKMIMASIGMKREDRLSTDPKSVILSKYLRRLESRERRKPKAEAPKLTLREQLGVH